MTAAEPVAAGEPPLYFFISYARPDSNDGTFLLRFFRDLRHEVRVRCGHARAEEVGFLDRSSLRPGDDWSAELVAALARARTFVAICSPTFFASENCGREWEFFDDRLRQLEEKGSSRAPLILPIMWIPMHPPPILAELQYSHEDLGADYARYGLRYLLQLKRNRDQYQHFLVMLADRIVELALAIELPPLTDLPHFPEIGNAFERRDRRSGRPGSAEPSGPRPAELMPSGSTAAEPMLPGLTRRPRAEAGGEAAAQEARPDPEDAAAPGSIGGARGEMTATADQVGGAQSTSQDQETDTEQEHAVGDPATEKPTGGPVEGYSDNHGRQLPPVDTKDRLASLGMVSGVSGPKRVTFVLVVTSSSQLANVRQHLVYYGHDFADWKPYHPHPDRRVCVAAQFVAARQEMESRIEMLTPSVVGLLEQSRNNNEVVVFIIDVWTATMEPFRSELRAYDRRNEPTTGVMVPWNPDDEETREHHDRLRAELAETLSNNMIRLDGLFQDEVTAHQFEEALAKIIAGIQARIFARKRAFRRPAGSRPRPRPSIEGPR
ncbi:TIR-like protein FxsC [Frankia sp. R82]|uniref:TIR-like protein FxsC n=1 Tax=Frankia sp. R82 TaxID=2950553 RepID=UPI0020439196|nr:TIR-like protein FxsC [Frankia sp. R82]MCM3882068.1 TIR-like protein FxsC [Frankia sp. R82]